MGDLGWMGIAAGVMGLAAAIITILAIVLHRFRKGKEASKPPDDEG
jgi:hypothetical protein